MSQRGESSWMNDVIKTEPLLSAVLVVSVILGLVFMLVGLPPLGGICFVVALVVALTMVFKVMNEKSDE